ncbi:DUF2283 domain-containing protein [Methylomonas rosea]|uniref:DUF2283 domain-containing protein n=1 Tax=Methylomonas rosea TaxID=2952227 RepID=A0ABT1TRQ2_9GAMM|nr:DUF2283 domain-containing protein [Methylomonas sp. WSC-7]MCQ8117460.1 DUF2283 domain-containing protein [Methylomonas sp. WSC-7]
MKITYFEVTDTLYIEFCKAERLETFDYDDNTLIDVDVVGHVCGITVEHAKQGVDLQRLSFEQVSWHAA